MRNTIVDSGGCANNAPVSLGHNLSSDNTCALTNTGDLTNTNPLLGPLQDNGGPARTQTRDPRGTEDAEHLESAEVEARRPELEATIERITKTIEEKLRENDVPFVQVQGRVKRLYSLWKKLMGKSLLCELR